MPALVHPRKALFAGETPFPVIPSCEHFAGSEKLILKAFELQDRLGGTFDITMDLEDGAAAGQEREHAEMVVRLARSAENRRGMAGVRVHDYTHPAWKQDVDLVVAGAGDVVRYLTIPKPTAARQVAEMIDHIQGAARKAGLRRHIPIHVLVETHGALREVDAIAALPWLEVLDFGLMDFVSAHHGAIPSSAMRSPGQFEHALVARAKADVVAAALARGVVPSHNVTLDLKNPYQTWEDARRARTELGFLRMWSIHPAQIQPIVDAMAPDFREVAQACAILLGAQQASWGPIQHAGEADHRPTHPHLFPLLQRARLSGQKLPAEAETAFFA